MSCGARPKSAPAACCPTPMVFKCCLPSMCCPEPPRCCTAPPSCCIPKKMEKLSSQFYGHSRRPQKRYPQCNFLKPCIDTRIYRNGEAMTLSFAGHIPGEQYIHGRNLPTASTYAKKRLCTYTPYEFVDNDGCCSFCTYNPGCCC